MISVWLRNVGDDEIDCWVPCAKDDPGAVEFIAVLTSGEGGKSDG